MCCILPRVCLNFPWYYISVLWKVFIVNGSASISYFSFIESVLKCLSNVLIIPVGNNSFTSSMIWSVLSILKPRGDWKIQKYRYLSTDPSWTFISKRSSKSFQFKKCCLIISSVDKIISRHCNKIHCNIREDFDVDNMINCDFNIFKNCDHCIKESIPLSSS